VETPQKRLTSFPGPSVGDFFFIFREGLLLCLVISLIGELTMKPQIDITDPKVQEACAAILREVVHGNDDSPEVWKLIAVGAAE